MASYFMALFVDEPNEVLVVLGDPSQAEEGCLDPMFFKQSQDSQGVLLNTGRKAGPRVGINDPREHMDLEILFQIDT